jgi:hypothetical protein
VVTRKGKKLEEIPDTCSNCRFFKLDEEKDEAGFCRRFPPVYMPSDDESIGGGWTFSVTWFDGWCGEHKGREQ